jgi:peptide chain release factor
MINFGITERKKQELEQRMQKCNLFEKDIEEKFVRSSGAGGQKVNKSSTCVYLKHIASGLSVKIQKSRSQGLNRYYARKKMCELLENRI